MSDVRGVKVKARSDVRGVKVKARRAGFLTRGGCAQGAFGSICRPLGCYDWEVRSRWQSVLLSPPGRTQEASTTDSDLAGCRG